VTISKRAPGPTRVLIEPSPEPIRLMMVEPRNLFGAGVREILDREDDIEVVAQVGTPDEALPVVEEAAPDVVLVSSPIADPPETDATLQLRHETPDAAYVVLGGSDDDASIAGAIEIRAMGHVAEVAEPEELVDTIRRVAQGEDLLSVELDGRPDLVDRMLDGFRATAQAEPPAPCPLTARELEVLALVGEGLRNREIAESLDLTEQTVKNHVGAAMHKLGAPTRTRAVMSAIRNEWLPSPAGADTEAILTDA
jgi:two-component system, NarL family, response regulator DevR